MNANDIEYLKKYYQGDLEEALERLKNKEPVQYIVGNVNFYGNEIEVNPNVLIPRFETEELIEKTIQHIQKLNIEIKDIVDLGTGSGCIAITLKKHFPEAQITAVDISKEALQVAQRNAESNDVKIEWKQGNMLDPLTKKYDLIISNPPYISEEEKIMDIVKNNEPHLALYAKHNGLYYYEQILKKAKKYLKEKYLIAFEIGYQQGKEIISLAHTYLKESTILLEQDLQGKDRFIFIYHIPLMNET